MQGWLKFRIPVVILVAALSVAAVSGARAAAPPWPQAAEGIAGGSYWCPSLGTSIPDSQTCPGAASTTYYGTTALYTCTDVYGNVYQSATPCTTFASTTAALYSCPNGLSGVYESSVPCQTSYSTPYYGTAYSTTALYTCTDGYGNVYQSATPCTAYSSGTIELYTCPTGAGGTYQSSTPCQTYYTVPTATGTQIIPGGFACVDAYGNVVQSRIPCSSFGICPNDIIVAPVGSHC